MQGQHAGASPGLQVIRCILSMGFGTDEPAHKEKKRKFRFPGKVLCANLDREHSANDVITEST